MAHQGLAPTSPASQGTAKLEKRPSNQDVFAAAEADVGMFDLRERMLLAIPKKGRLHEQCVDLLKSIGLQWKRKERLDVALCSNMPMAIVFLPAADIPRYVAGSNVDMGITGEDMISESQSDVESLMPLGFGKCRLCLQAPKWRQYTTGADLIGKRIVTSFPFLTRQHFNRLGEEVGKAPTQISYVSGSVEAACGLGLADAIVDLVESGGTMEAHGLRIVEELMTTQAVLVANKGSSFPQMIKKIHRRFEGIIVARKYRMIVYNAHKDVLDKCKEITPGKTAPTVSPLQDEGWFAVNAMVSSSEANEVMDKLADAGATAILLTEIMNTRAAV